MKTHYDLLSVEPSADADTIKKAFRREIARYHPDKVVHLGPEFQEMAATRAAELTVAYKTLSDSGMREEYDASIRGSGLPAEGDPNPPPEPGEVARQPGQPPFEPGAQTPPSGQRRFATERAGRDLILRRAIVERVRGVVESLFGAVETPVVRGFDAALVPVARPRFLGAPPPRVLLKLNEVVDAAAVAEAWNAAARSRVQTGKSPVVVLLFGRELPPPRELRSAMESAALQRRPADAPHELVVAVVNAGDWTYLTRDDVSPVVRKLLDRVGGAR